MITTILFLYIKACGPWIDSQPVYKKNNFGRFHQCVLRFQLRSQPGTRRPITPVTLSAMHVLQKRLLLMLSVLETLHIFVYVVTWRVQWCPMQNLMIGESACRFDHTLLSDFRLSRPQKMLEICSQTSVDLPIKRPKGLFLSSHSSSSCSACNNPNNASKTGKLKRNNNKLITTFSTFKKRK